MSRKYLIFFIVPAVMLFVSVAPVMAEITAYGCPSVYRLAFKLGSSFSATGIDTVEVKTMKTMQALQLLQEGSIDIALISRKLKEDEKKKGLAGLHAASEGLVLIVHENNPVKDLTTDKVKNIISGNLKKWSDTEAGANFDQPIVVVNHLPECGITMAAKMRFVGDMMAKLAQGITKNECQEVINEVADNINYIGYDPHFMTANKKGIALVKVNGVCPDKLSIKTGQYPYAFAMSFVYKENPKIEVLEFIEFIKSESGRKIIDEAGYVTVQ